MITYAVVAHDVVALFPPSRFEGCDLMSPFCWRDGDVFRMVMRVVPRSGHPTGVIWSARNEDGLHFHLVAKPAISPGPSDEGHGDRMASNLAITKGLIMSEAVMMALAP